MRSSATRIACAGTLDEDVTNFSFTSARENAWEAAVALANAQSDIERAGVRNWSTFAPRRPRG